MYKIISYATSANMGPGFDCLGVCLSMANTMTFTEFDDAIIINNHADTMRNRSNLIISSLYDTCDLLGIHLKGVKLDIKTVIPLARGLGSSASCISAGVAAAFMFAGKTPEKKDIFEISAKLEGHADNVAPNIFGGMTLAYRQDEHDRCIQYKIHEDYKFIAVIPDFQLSTQKAREVMPIAYPREDVVFNLSRVGMLISALQVGNDDLLKVALEDKLHQPYRIPLIKGYEEILKVCNESGTIGTYLSGAGPTIMAIGRTDDTAKKIMYGLRERNINAQVESLTIDYEGLECYQLK